MATDKEEPVYHIDLTADGEENVPAVPETVKPEPEPTPEAPAPASTTEKSAHTPAESTPAPDTSRAEKIETIDKVENIEATEPPTLATPTPAAPSVPPQKRRSNVGLWITIVVLATIIIAGATWYVVTHVLTDKDKSEVVDSEADGDTETAQVISYETDDTPNYPPEGDINQTELENPTTEPLNPTDEDVNGGSANRQRSATDNDPNAASQSADNASNSSNEGAEPVTGYVFSGSITNTDGSTSNLVIEANVSNYGSVNGLSEHASHNYSIYGHYIKEINRLVINEQNGGKFEGTLSGSQYTGKYRDANGTVHTFTFRVRIHQR